MSKISSPFLLSVSPSFTNTHFCCLPFSSYLLFLSYSFKASFICLPNTSTGFFVIILHLLLHAVFSCLHFTFPLSPSLNVHILLHVVIYLLFSVTSTTHLFYFLLYAPFYSSVSLPSLSSPSLNLSYSTSCCHPFSFVIIYQALSLFLVVSFVLLLLLFCIYITFFLSLPSISSVFSSLFVIIYQALPLSSLYLLYALVVLHLFHLSPFSPLTKPFLF